MVAQIPIICRECGSSAILHNWCLGDLFDRNSKNFQSRENSWPREANLKIIMKICKDPPLPKLKSTRIVVWWNDVPYLEDYSTKSRSAFGLIVSGALVIRWWEWRQLVGTILANMVSEEPNMSKMNKNVNNQHKHNNYAYARVLNLRLGLDQLMTCNSFREINKSNVMSCCNALWLTSLGRPGCWWNVLREFGRYIPESDY